MSVPYIVVAKRDPDDPTGKVYYPKATSYGIIERDKLCADIANATSLTEGDVQNCVASFVTIFNRYLSLGFKVRIDGIGLFEIGFSTISDQDKTKVTADNIKAKRLCLRPAVSIRDDVVRFEVEQYKEKATN